MRVTETSLQEKDQRIGELDRLIRRMEDVKASLKAFSQYKGMDVCLCGGRGIYSMLFAHCKIKIPQFFAVHNISPT